jgi:hypothetical protein
MYCTQSQPWLKKGKAKRTTPAAQPPPIPTNPELPHTNPEQSQATQPRESTQASWTVDDETCLIDFLQDHQAEAGNGFNFKIATWHIAAAEMLKHQTKGAVKTSLTCKNKFSMVSHLNVMCLPTDTFF